MSALVYPSVSTPIRVGVIGVGHMANIMRDFFILCPTSSLPGFVILNRTEGLIKPSAMALVTLKTIKLYYRW